MSALAERNAKDVAQRRRDEVADALHFAVYGHDEHIAEGCLFANEGGAACSRDYDAMPYREAEPEPLNWYIGTGIGALYGLPTADRFHAELAGWNVTLGRRREETPAQEVLAGLLLDGDDFDDEAVDE